MKKAKKKKILTFLILVFGSFFTTGSSLFYYMSVYQPDYSYSSIPFQKGMSFTTWGAFSFNSETAKQEVLEMKEAGIEWIAVNMWWTQENISSTEIQTGPWTDSAASIIKFFYFIHSIGMHILFKPMLDSRDGVWRSYIEASPEWMEAYKEFIKFTAEIAEYGNAEVLSIGCEMGNWQVHTEEVKELISDVRKIYTGKLTYAANHDSFWYIDWWDQVDIIGVDAYFSFTLSYIPSLQDMIDVWNGFYDDLNTFQRRWNKPILFVELGCQNRDGCNIAPNDDKFRLEQDEEEFKMFYQSMFESKLWTAPWFKGTYWWIWDCRVIDESTDNQFTPQLSIIKSTLNQYYSSDRIVFHPNYWFITLFILILGGLLIFVSIEVVNAYYKEKEDHPQEIKEEEPKRRKINEFALFTTLNGLIFGVFLFWAFNYYNQLLFNLLYSTVTKSFFLGEGVIATLLFILMALLSMVVLWIIIQRLSNRLVKKRREIIILLMFICVILILVLETYLGNFLSNEASLKFYICLQLMILLGILFTMMFIYAFPEKEFKNIDKNTRIALIFKVIFGIITIVGLVLLLLSLSMLINTKLPSLLCGFILLGAIPLFIYYSNILTESNSFREFTDTRTFKEMIKLNRMKIIEFAVCLLAMGYYFGILRSIDSHTLINMNLILLPGFFIPLGISFIIAVTCTILIQKLDVFKTQNMFSFSEMNKEQMLTFLFKIAIISSVIILVINWIFCAFSEWISLIIGAIPIMIIFVIFFIGMVNSEAIFQDITSWKRLTIYLIVTLTVAFSANGILVGLLYVFTFFTIKDGQIVVKIAFEEELGFDAVSLIYAIQLLIALLIIAISYVIVKVVLPKMRIK